MTKIIAFSGRKQSGKSTSGEFVHKILHSFHPSITCGLYSFADPLKKNICIDLLGLTEKQCYGSDDDKNSLTNIAWKSMPDYNISWTYSKDYDPSGYMTARQVMEFVGTRIFRAMKQNVWVEATLKQIQKDNYDIAIILDTRFPDEVDPILNIGGYVIRLTRNPFHSSSEPEVALDPDRYDWSKFSLILDNKNMTEEEKNNEIASLLKRMEF